jgi:Ras family protein U
MNRGNVKCVFVGDSKVGKTSLIVAYTTNGFCERYNPTTFDNYSVVVTVDNKPLKIELCDTAGNSDFDSLRLLSYNESSVFLLCFSVMSPPTLQSILTKWLPEVRAVAPETPVILVGTQSDLRHNLTQVLESKRRGINPIDSKQARKLADQYNIDFIECSALTQQNLKEVFDKAILHTLSKNSTSNNSKTQKQRIIPSSINNNNNNNSSEKQQRTPTSFKESFRKLVTMTRKLI